MVIFVPKTQAFIAGAARRCLPRSHLFAFSTGELYWTVSEIPYGYHFILNFLHESFLFISVLTIDLGELRRSHVWFVKGVYIKLMIELCGLLIYSLCSVPRVDRCSCISGRCGFSRKKLTNQRSPSSTINRGNQNGGLCSADLWLS